jgi:hypothetical protein
MYIYIYQKVSVHLMITIQKVAWLNMTAWQPTARAGGDTRLTLTPSVFPNHNYGIVVSDVSNIFACFLYCNHEVHRNF